MMRRVTILHIKQYGEYWLSIIKNSRESIKNREYLIQFEAKFEKSLNTEEGAWKEKILLDCPFKLSLNKTTNVIAYLIILF
jgi:hypothetical protein